MMVLRWFAMAAIVVVGFADDEPKPHFIAILADDMGFNDIGYNNNEVKTPKMDALAADGLILNNNYVQAICTPSRSAFITGRYPSSTGMQHGVIGSWTPHCAPTDVPFIPSLLRDAGYQTHLSGKWHLGSCQWNCTPTERGFDSFVGLLEGMGDYYSHRFQGGYDWRKNKDIDSTAVGEYTTDLVRDRAVSLIEDYADGDKPLFMWLTFTAPHTPLQAPEEFKDLYPDTPEPRKTYLAMISALDDAVGQIVDALKDNQLWENTFLVFSSDNGGEKGGKASNSPLRGGKGSLFEGGTRVPGFVAGPLVEESGTSDGCEQFTYFPADDEDFDGTEQTDLLLNGGDSERDEIIYNIDVEWTGGFFMGNAAIRKNDLKMIWGFPGFVDGYGGDLKAFHQNNDYLAIINKTVDDYTDIPAERPFQYWLSAQEVANQQAIVKAIGIDGITEEEMEEGRGQVLLFDLSDDPEERNNIADDEDYEDIIDELKDRIMEYIENKYIPTPQTVKERWFAESSPMKNPPLNAWTPGWCDDVSMSSKNWAEQSPRHKANLKHSQEL